MLSEEDKASVRAEEIYREEVRRSLGPRDSLARKFWAVLNQPFAIWLLGSVALAIVAQMYACTVERSRRHAEAERIEREIRHRVALVEQYLAEAPEMSDKYDRAVEVVLESPTSLNDLGLSLHPQLAALSLVNLLAERHRLTGKPADVDVRTKAQRDWCDTIREPDVGTLDGFRAALDL